MLLALAVVSSLVPPSDWPSFRGPGGSATAPELHLDLPPDQGDVAWFTELPGDGHASPVVAGNQVFATWVRNGEGGKPELGVASLDLESGEVRWSRNLPLQGHSQHRLNSFASATPVVDGGRLCLVHGDGQDLVATSLDVRDGQTLWRRTVGRWEAQHGLGSSPVIADGVLVVCNVHEAQDANPPSGLLGLDPATGEELWTLPRETVRAAYSTPVTRQLPEGGTELILSSTAHGLTGVRARTGELRWNTPSLFEERCVASPVLAGGSVYASAGKGRGGIEAVCASLDDGAAAARVAWRDGRAIPYVPSGVSNGELLFTVSDAGVASAVDLATGESLWRERLEGGYYASIILAGEVLVLLNTEGRLEFLEAGATFRSLGSMELGHTTQATPAVADGRLLVRTAAGITCLRSTQDAEPTGQAHADLIVVGSIITVDPDLPRTEALAIGDGRIMTRGTRESVLRDHRGPQTRILDVGEGTAYPGFIESHAHFLGVGDSRVQLDLRGAKSFEEIVELVRAAASEAEPGELIRGRGWHQEKWSSLPADAVEGLPRHQLLSSVSPENPVILTHASGHATFANARAMELSGISYGTPDPSGGELVRDPDGEPIGVFRETASELLRPAWMFAKEPDPERLAKLAVAECLEKGVTSFQDAGSPIEAIDVYRRMEDEGTLDVRLWLMLRESPERLEAHLPDVLVRRYGEEKLTVGGLKASLDGALGSHGAWLLEPYADLPSSSGLNTVPLEDISALARLALEHGLQLCIHAIGDRANRETLDLYEEVLAEREAADLRWRIEHAQHLHPDDIPRFGELGVIAAMQAVHCTSDGPWVPQRLGMERTREGAYVWRSLLESGAVIANGTDAPVEDLDPLPSFHASVTRLMGNGKVFLGTQVMTREQALRSYTLDAAFAAHEDDIKGSLEPGKLADIVVLDRDLLTCKESEILEARVLYTIVGGKVLYEAD